MGSQPAHNLSVPPGFAGMNIATWTADFGIDMPGVSLQWQFAFAGYSNFAGGSQVCSALRAGSALEEGPAWSPREFHSRMGTAVT